ncbi:MAG: UvrB/UvrC motif-containing protein, partial [Nitrospinota bacterium]
LLREGLDLPEVSLVAILDADKEGFLRSERSLIQTIGRAARNVHGTVIMYADAMTKSLRRAVEETRRRRELQLVYNAEHGITPETIVKEIHELIESVCEADYVTVPVEEEPFGGVPPEELPRLVADLKREMRRAAAAYEFERAAELRDRIYELEGRELQYG